MYIKYPKPNNCLVIIRKKLSIGNIASKVRISSHSINFNKEKKSQIKMLSKLSSRISNAFSRNFSAAPQYYTPSSTSNAAIIGMLASDATSVNHYTIHYQYLKQKEAADIH